MPSPNVVVVWFEPVHIVCSDIVSYRTLAVVRGYRFTVSEHSVTTYLYIPIVFSEVLVVELYALSRVVNRGKVLLFYRWLYLFVHELEHTYVLSLRYSVRGGY